MILRGYCIYDNKGGLYHAPFFMVSDGAATRALQDMVTDNNTTIGRHPSDYSLWLVATFDDGSASVVPCPPLHVINADQLVPPQRTLPFDVPPNLRFEDFNAWMEKNANGKA